MAITSPPVLGHHTVAIGIDKDKASQGAVKWAVEHLLGGRNSNVVLVHVKLKTQNIESQPQPDAESQQLFLPYRGFCARKGFDAHEVVLHETDVSTALINYLRSKSIGAIVVGASSRNALTRHFKQADVPTSLIKAAPGYCAVYVISKGKVQFTRPSTSATPCYTNTAPSNTYNQPCNTNNTPPRLPSPKTSAKNAKARSYINYFASDSLSSNSSSTTTTSSTSSHDKYTLTSSANPYLSAPDSPSGYDYGSRDFDKNLSNEGYYSARLQSMLRPSHPENRTSFEDSSRDYYGRENRKSDDMDQLPWNNQGARTPSRFMQTPPRFMQSPSPAPRIMQSRGHNLSHMRPTLSDGSNHNSLSSSSFGSSTGSSSSSNHSHDQSYYGSTNTHSNAENELDNEIRRLRLDAQKAMDLYQSICDQEATARHQADSMSNQDETHTMENIEVSKQAAMLVADLERLRIKAATDATNMARRLAELETGKENMVEQRVKSRDDQERTRNASPVAHRIYSLEEIEVATNYFSVSQKIGEGGYGPVYRAMLHHTPVAIKVLRPDVSQGLKQFQKEIEVLEHIRHPNMVVLLGSCPQYGCLVYEYMDNGSLEDRLFRKNGTPPIPWKARFKIAAEIATGLLFLHQAKPEPMVHRDLKPANILLDVNFSSKIADVALARLVPQSVSNEMTQYHMTAAAGTFCYIDPEYQQTGQLGTKSDVYSLGVILLQIITAKPAMALAYHVEEAIEMGKFPKMLDPAVSDWPVEQALSMAQLALKCCELRKKDRPNLRSIVLPELIRLRDFAMNT